MGVILKRIHDRYRHWSVRGARVWSNSELKLISSKLKGRVINVSAWSDLDKQGDSYRSYFTSADEYLTSNYKGWRGAAGKDDYLIDLVAPLPKSLENQFDVVFNHTTLEHVFEVRQAFKNLCLMSRDLVILVVPSVQPLHGPPDGDFWRFSPYAMRRLFDENNFDILIERLGPVRGAVKYLFYVASKKPDYWRSTFNAIGIDAEVEDRSQNLSIY